MGGTVARTAFGEPAALLEATLLVSAALRAFSSTSASWRPPLAAFPTARTAIVTPSRAVLALLPLEPLRPVGPLVARPVEALLPLVPLGGSAAPLALLASWRWLLSPGRRWRTRRALLAWRGFLALRLGRRPVLDYRRESQRLGLWLGCGRDAAALLLRLRRLIRGFTAAAASTPAPAPAPAAFRLHLLARKRRLVAEPGALWLAQGRRRRDRFRLALLRLVGRGGWRRGRSRRALLVLEDVCPEVTVHRLDLSCSARGCGSG
jgi:hypothetical protein